VGLHSEERRAEREAINEEGYLLSLTYFISYPMNSETNDKNHIRNIQKQGPGYEFLNNRNL